MLIDIITGSRGDILRVAPLLDAIQQEQRKGTRLGYRFIYTGNDIDINLDKDLFTQLQISRPNIYLDCNKENTSSIIASCCVKYERVINTNKPDFVLLTGRTAAVWACGYIAKCQQDIQVGLLNSGLSKLYPQGINHINSKLLETIADYHFTSSQYANQLLREDGHPEDRLFLVGNSIADIVIKSSNKLVQPALWNELNLSNKKYALLVFDSIVANSEPCLKSLITSIHETYGDIKIIIISGPEISNAIDEQTIQAQNLYLLRRLGFHQLGFLLCNAKLVVSDSSTVVEHCTMYKDVELIDASKQNNQITLKQKITTGTIPYMWDGKTAERIIMILKRISTIFKNT